MTRPRFALHRRDLLKLAAAAAAPLLVPRGVLGDDKQAPPSERFTVGVIGTGKMANDYHLPSLLGFDDVQVLAVCDVDTNRRNHAKRRVDEKYGNTNCAAVTDFQQILDRKDIQAVVIATPDHWHAIPAILACQAGKDVYCEKPLTLTILEAKRCIDAARKHGRVFQTGSQQRSSIFGPFRQACEIVRSGRLGEIKTVSVGVGGPSHWCDLAEEPLEPGLDWPMWLGQAPERPYHSTLSPRGLHNHFPAWRAYREYSGGGLTDMGAHHYDIAQWCLGMDESGPVEVHPPEDSQAEEGARHVYSNGVTLIHGGPQGCTFEGTGGKLHIGRGVLESWPKSIAKEPLRADEVHLPQSPGHHRDWLNAVKSRGRPVADVEVGARSVTVCHLANLAYWHRRPLRWDPAKWEFVGSEEDRALVDRERRNPWQLPAV